jgi:hypothetical protein
MPEPGPVSLSVTKATQGGQTVIRLASPTGRTLVIAKTTLEDTLYTVLWLLGQHDRATISRPMVAALSKLGTIEGPEKKEPHEAPTQREPKG